MKATGIIRRIDDLGRLIVPKEIRRNLCIREGDAFEIFCDKDSVTFRKYRPSDAHRDLLATLKSNIQEDDYLKNRSALLQKIKELDALLCEDIADA